MKIDINAAIAAGADPAKLGVKPVVLGNMVDKSTVWTKSTAITVFATNTVMVAVIDGCRCPCTALTVPSEMTVNVHRCEGRYGRTVELEMLDGEWDSDGDAVMFWQRRAEWIRGHKARLQIIRNPKGVSPITLAAKAKAKRRRRDAMAISAFAKWCGGHGPTLAMCKAIE